MTCDVKQNIQLMNVRFAVQLVNLSLMSNDLHVPVYMFRIVDIVIIILMYTGNIMSYNEGKDIQSLTVQKLK